MKTASRFKVAGIFAAIVCISLSCISEDSDEPIYMPGHFPGASGTPFIRAVPNRQFIGTGDTVSIRVEYLVGSGESAVGVGGREITVTPANPGDWVSRNTVTTNSSGWAEVSFYSLVEGAADITFTSGTIERVATIEVTNTPPLNMTIYASPTVLAADGSSKATITVQVKNNNNNPIVGEDILFSTSAGLITARATTDADGKATAELTSERSNRVATVTAALESDGTRIARMAVEFSGVTMTAAASPSTIRPDGVDSSVVTVILRDAANNLIVGERISFGDNEFITRADSVTNSRGEARAVVKSNLPGGTWVNASAGGARVEAGAAVMFSNQIITVTPSEECAPRHPDNYGINGVCEFILAYRSNEDDSPIAEAELIVSVTAGSFNFGSPEPAPTVIYANILTTGEDGTARLRLNFPGFAGPITIQVRGSSHGGSATAMEVINVRAGNVATLELTGSPSVIGTNNGRARLSATVLDANGNRIPGALISFNITRGSGGGEYLDQATATTGSDGVASVSLIAGSLPSTFEGVWVVATTVGGGFHSNTLKLTIAGPPRHITVRRNLERITDYNTTYGKAISALVTDINQNPVPDGTEVTFSTEVTGYVFYKRAARFTGEIGERAWDSTAFTMIVINSEHLVQSRPYNRYPYFDDINRNGLPDSGLHVEPCDPTDRSGAAVCSGGVFADYNGNGIRDFVEPFDMRDPKAAAMTAAERNELYHRTETYGEYFTPSRLDYDLDWNRNGIPDPNTTVVITRTVLTSGGIAPNELIYGQSDAGRAQVTVRAEAQGLVTSSPEVFILPIPENSKFWNPFDR